MHTNNTPSREGLHAVSGVGYQNLADTAALIAEVEARGATMVVDVRESPSSIRTDFTGADIAVACEAAGIEYRHEPALGNPPWNRAGFKHAGPDREKARAHMAERLQGTPARAAMNRIWRALRTGPVVLMCAEPDGAACHRDCVLDAFAAKGIQVARAPVPDAAPTLFGK